MSGVRGDRDRSVRRPMTRRILLSAAGAQLLWCSPAAEQLFAPAVGRLFASCVGQGAKIPPRAA